MNKIILGFIASIFLASSLIAQESKTEEMFAAEFSLNWSPTFKEALKKSKKEKKPVLIYFTGSDWCGPCKVLDKNLFHTEKFKSIADQDLILYEADNPRNKDLVAPEKLEVNDKLKRKYRIKSYPSLVFVDHRGREIATKKGVILTEYYYPFFQSVIRDY